MKEKHRAPTIQEVGFSKQALKAEDSQHLRDLQSAISMTVTLLSTIQNPKTGSSPVLDIAMTGSLRRLEEIVDKEKIEIIAVPRAFKKAKTVPEFDADPDISLEQNQLISRLEQMKSKGFFPAWLKIRDIEYLADPPTIIVTAANTREVRARWHIYMVPGRHHWGINRIITSGADGFNAWAKRNKPNGMLPKHISYDLITCGLIDTSGKRPKPIKAKTELEVFELCGISYIPVLFRQDGLWKTYLETNQNIREKDEPEIIAGLEAMKKQLQKKL